MVERFQDEFVTWHHKTLIGVKVDEVFGMDSKSGKVWTELARQIYCEQGEPEYRVIEHFENGAPFIDGYPGRVSITHTSHLFVVATLPKTPEVSLDIFNTRSAMGIDAESLDRKQVLKVRDKFLNKEEVKIISEESLRDNILAWTIKEAAIKASLFPAINYREDIKIIRLPQLLSDPMKGSFKDLGEAVLVLNNETYELKLFSYESYGCVVTIAISPQCATFGKALRQ